jgi:dynein heavy chain
MTYTYIHIYTYTSQLLALVVKFERPDLAAQRAALILQQNLFTIKVKQLEDQILLRLADAQVGVMS